MEQFKEDTLKLYERLTNNGIKPYMFWAGRMAIVSRSICNCSVLQLSHYIEQLQWVTEQYDNAIVELTEQN